MRKSFILFSRALLLRCPACGGGPLFTRWVRAKAACPGCRLKLDREEGHFVGAVAFNLVAAELLWIVGLVTTIALTWPTPPWTAITVISVAAMILFPLFFYPFSRTLWYAFDLYFQPVQRKEFPGEL
ncbi:MAG: DUF983 domain-containing protein [Chloroflexota bacterium]